MSNNSSRSTPVVSVESDKYVLGYVFLRNADDHNGEYLSDRITVLPKEDIFFNGTNISCHVINTNFMTLARQACMRFVVFVRVDTDEALFVNSEMHKIYAPVAKIISKTYDTEGDPPTELIDTYYTLNKPFYNVAAKTFWNTEEMSKVNAGMPTVTICGDSLYINDGFHNKGTNNYGCNNIGDYNFGSYNEGSFNYGNNNMGNDNHGDYNVGSHNLGNSNEGFRNCGDYNIGMFNEGQNKIGIFNTTINAANGEVPKREPNTIYAFNKPICRSDFMTIKTSLIRVLNTFDGIKVLKKWVNEAENCTEKFGNVCHDTLRKLWQTRDNYALFDEFRALPTATPYLYHSHGWNKKYIAARIQNATKDEMMAITSLPNFDIDIFCKIFDINNVTFE